MDSNRNSEASLGRMFRYLSSMELVFYNGLTNSLRCLLMDRGLDCKGRNGFQEDAIVEYVKIILVVIFLLVDVTGDVEKIPCEFTKLVTKSLVSSCSSVGMSGTPFSRKNEATTTKVMFPMFTL